ncbi:MAG: hypothetical protein AAFN80_15125, partial [Pseudomonadota bacterium]
LKHALASSWRKIAESAFLRFNTLISKQKRATLRSPFSERLVLCDPALIRLSPQEGRDFDLFFLFRARLWRGLA